MDMQPAASLQELKSDVAPIIMPRNGESDYNLVFPADNGKSENWNAGPMALRQRFYLGAPVPSSPALSGNAVFIAAMDGNVYAFASAP